MAEGDTERISFGGGEAVEIPKSLPVLPVRDAVVFPGMNVPLSVGRARSRDHVAPRDVRREPSGAHGRRGCYTFGCSSACAKTAARTPRHTPS